MKIITGKNGQEIALLETDNCICRFVEQSGRLDHDQNMLPIVLSYIPIGGVVLDVGCFIGDHAIAYAERVGRNGMVLGFEPDEDSFMCMGFNMVNYDNFVGYNIALGVGGHKASLNKVATNEGMNYLTDGNDINVHSLDTVIPAQNLNRIDFIKIDCEGYELDVLQGGQRTIQKYKPKMLIEINEMTLNRNNVKREDIYEWLDVAGYVYHNIYPNHGLFESQMDILCQPIR